MPSVEIDETVLVYHQRQREEWNRGNRSLVPDFVDPIVFVKNSPRRHFGEMFVLRHYHETGGWMGVSAYALGNELRGSKRRQAGRSLIRQVVPAHRLTEFHRLPATDGELRSGAGNPDLFLYRDDGRYMFVEVKIRPDKLGPKQFRRIAKILRTLDCPVEIVHLREANQRYAPKRYMFDLSRLKGVAV